MPRIVRNKGIFHVESDITAIGSDISLGNIEVVKTHCFCGVRFFSDSEGNNAAIPTDGIVTITIKTVNTDQFFEDPSLENVIQASSPETIAWEANTLAVNATALNVDVATHYQIVVTCNET